MLWHKFLRVIKMIRINYSSKYSMGVASKYWKNTEVTHTSMDESNFDFFYKEILKIMQPTEKEDILDYGGGNGEISYRFKKDDFNIKHCDLSPVMVKNAIEKFNLSSCECGKIDEYKYDKILFHNAFFYIHPGLEKNFLENIYLNLKNKGKLYITDTPDFDKRCQLGQGKLYMWTTRLFPVYQIDLTGFFIENSTLLKIANEIGFTIEKYDSWTDYRSHWVLTKVNNAK